MIRPDWSKWSKVSAPGYTFISKADIMPASGNARVVIIRIRHKGSSNEAAVTKTVFTFIGTWQGLAKDWGASWDCGSLSNALANENGVIVETEGRAP